MLPHLGRIVDYKTKESGELYNLCESIGDAEDAIVAGMLNGVDLEEARTKIDSWKNELRLLIKVDTSWEPENGDWRMGCY